MTNGSWIDANRVVSAEPGPRDSFVVTLVDGKRVAVEPADAYEQALSRANALASRIKEPVKLLPMQVGELLGFMGLEKADLGAPSPTDAEMRRLVVATCQEAMLEASDVTVRREAHSVLVGMGKVA